jgi:hypothetical protein
MSKFRSIAVRVAVIGVAAVGSVGVATAAPSGSGNAQDTVDELASDGYAVQINGSPAGPLSSCSVTGVHGLPNDPVTIPAPKLLTTVYVDLDCMSNN